MLFFEINQKYGKAIARLLRETGFTRISVVKDIFGADRFVRANHSGS
jgi:methylase of polypeptide subunit release factors